MYDFVDLYILSGGSSFVYQNPPIDTIFGVLVSFYTIRTHLKNSTVSSANLGADGN
jgi:divalent metal cation (Fe/Co/Zn/Cd) transporter